MVGRTISHYRVVSVLGRGGMGVVYEAEDTRLGRTVALKFLPESFSQDRLALERFRREARSASALNHPHICTIHDIDECEGELFLVMELLEGETLQKRLQSGPLAIPDLVAFGIQIADALQAAHAKKIVHRDLKPANIFLTVRRVAKILDFGLARTAADLTETVVGPTQLTATIADLTAPGTTVGTIAYMSPEQARGEPVDERTDLFSLGVVLYQAATGKLPFTGGNQLAAMHAILHDEPKPPRDLRPDLPREVEQVILQALQKDRAKRFQSAGDMLAELAAYQASLTASAAPAIGILRRQLKRPLIAACLALVLLSIAAGATWYLRRSARVRWAREQATPEIARLSDRGDFAAAYKLIRQAERYIPRDPILEKLYAAISSPVSIRTTPPGADIYLKLYAAPEAEWEPIGRSPLENFPLPILYYRVHITKAGYRDIESTANPGDPNPHFTLDLEGSIPPDMVRIPTGGLATQGGVAVPLGAYLIDRYELTNRQFKEFVDKGGYRDQKFWKEEFVRDGRRFSWQDAMALFRDSTGRPGPSTWELGEYRQGQDDYPVNGVSWYEAAAYAEFAGKQIPTVYHWRNATDLRSIFSDILQVSNFAGSGPARVGSYQGLGPFGTYDMAGNVKEWCWNRSGAKRYILGGSWNEPSYTFHDLDAKSPFDRSPTNGFRCVRYLEKPPPDALLGEFEKSERDYRKERPVPDQAFRILQSLYSYDRTELRPAIESVDESSPYWREEKVTFNAAYGKERVIAYLFLPKRATPPYQTVVYFPPANAQQLGSLKSGGIKLWDFVPRSGRALLYPIYKGTYERRGDAEPGGPSVYRDQVIAQAKDFRRSLDYLESRPDIDRSRLGFCGVSWGGHARSNHDRWGAASQSHGAACRRSAPGEKTSRGGRNQFSSTRHSAGVDGEWPLRLYLSPRYRAGPHVPAAGHTREGQAARAVRDRSCTGLAGNDQGDAGLVRPLPGAGGTERAVTRGLAGRTPWTPVDPTKHCDLPACGVE
ncbi:Serine/threonine protein kinase [Candidatus Sulfopaludibacter sp. SbA6]|nr:Serine/threonine protein kinase [Candidatus Sulfopaludibacter sp. SbA6]